jgi:hypothetical protein
VSVLKQLNCALAAQLTLTRRQCGVAGLCAALRMMTPPDLDAAGRRAYARFLLMDVPRAFAVSANGPVGSAGGALSADEAASQALADCAAAGGKGARLYAQDLSVLGAAPNTAIPPRAPFIETWNYSFAPDARFLWRGPAAARGLYIWAHGTSTDPTGLQPPPHVRAFNNAGYDIVRFDREPNADDVERAAGWLRAGIRRLRSLGWRRVLVGGHSRGAWNGLQMLRVADLADAVIADSPAAHGTAGGFFMSSQIDDLRQIIAAVPRTRTRLVFIQFTDDMFCADPDDRVRLIERLRPRLGGLLTIDRPPGFSGHNAARDLRFAESFAAAMILASGQ